MGMYLALLLRWTFTKINKLGVLVLLSAPNRDASDSGLPDIRLILKPDTGYSVRPDIRLILKPDTGYSVRPDIRRFSLPLANNYE